MPSDDKPRGFRFVEIGVSSLDRSLDFYAGLLGFGPVDDPERANRPGTQWLSAETALIKLYEAKPQGQLSAGQDAPLGRGFKHIGWKVGSVRLQARPLRAANVQFTIDPVDALGEVTVAFFKDPDETLLEFVDRHVQYHTTFSAELAEQERVAAQNRPIDAGPVFDHVAVAVGDLGKSLARYKDVLGYQPIGELDFGGPDGALITYLGTGNGVLELFSYGKADTTTAPPVPREQLLGIRKVGVVPLTEATLEDLLLAGARHGDDGSGDDGLIDPDEIAVQLL